jgi:hypothetical protein
MKQDALWQDSTQNSQYAHLCNALYERELSQLSEAQSASVQALQGRLKSLPHYIRQAAEHMTWNRSPLALDVHNASWSAVQGNKPPLNHQDSLEISRWYFNWELPLGLVVPVYLESPGGARILLDSIDAIDQQAKGIRTNRFGWFYPEQGNEPAGGGRLLKANKKVMSSACGGHCWQGGKKIVPKQLTLRELLLSCAINWRNFRKLSSE